MKSVVILLTSLMVFGLGVISGCGHSVELEEASDLNKKVLKLFETKSYQEALPLAQRALQIREKYLGPEHPDTITSLNNLAGLYMTIDSSDMAMPLYYQVLKIQERTLGPDHPSNARILIVLGEIYKDRDAYDKAITLYQKGLAILEKPAPGEKEGIQIRINKLKEELEKGEVLIPHMTGHSFTKDSGMIHYVDNEKGFSIDYPGKWTPIPNSVMRKFKKANTGSKHIIMGVWYLNESPSIPTILFMTIKIEKVEKEISATKYCDIYFQEGGGKNYTTILKEGLSLNGLKAVKTISVKESSKGSPEKSIHLFLVQGGYVWTIQASSSGGLEKFDDNLNIIEKSIKSINFQSKK